MRRLAAVLLVVALSGCCVREPRGPRVALSPGLATAGQLILEAEKAGWDDDRFVVSNLRAAELATRAFTNPAERAQAESLYGQATLALAEWVVEKEKFDGVYTFNGLTYRLRVPPAGRGVWSAASFKSVGDAAKVRRTLLRHWHTRPGIGAPLVVKWRRDEQNRFARFEPPRGYIVPVTAAVAVKGNTATISFLDPAAVRTVKLGRTEYPLAADFSAPIVDRTRDIREFLIALEGAIHPDVRDAYLYLLQPYNPERIPVVFVHGLLSHPRMWRNVINDLQADPELAGKFQFLTFYYPTGWPISYSAMRFREELAAFEKAAGPHRKMVLVGHSMGGLLSRLQVIDPGRNLFNAMLSASDRDRLNRLPPDHLIRRISTFQANPNVDRVVFICTPHRGSRLADLSITRLFAGLVRLPVTMLDTASNAGLDFAKSIAGNPRELSSVRRLSPSNPMFKVMETIPIKVPYHSIVGDRGRGDTPNSSDGVVAYWSSHLAGAESEVIVPRDHGAFDDPKAIRELERILELELRGRR